MLTANAYDDLRLSPILGLILRDAVRQANSEPKPARISWLDGSRNDVGSRAVELSPGKIYTSSRPAVRVCRACARAGMVTGLCFSSFSWQR